jgi:uncharacterized membrane protein
MSHLLDTPHASIAEMSMPQRQRPGYRRDHPILRGIASICFVLAGANHFANPAFYQNIIPPRFPRPALLVAISGACEIAGGAGLAIPRLRRAAGWGLIALLLAVFPANIYMALAPQQTPTSFPSPPWSRWARLPLQGVLIAWVWLAAGLARRPDATPAGLPSQSDGGNLTATSSDPPR